MESEAHKKIPYGIWKPSFCNLESRSRKPKFRKEELLESRIPEGRPFGIRDPESTSWNLESKIVMDYLIWGDIEKVNIKCMLK